MKRWFLLSVIGLVVCILAACGNDEEIETETVESKSDQEEESFVEVSVKDAFYVMYSNIEETSENEDKELLIIELDITNTYSENIQVANSQDVTLLDDDEEIEAITYVHNDFDIDREIEIEVEDTYQHMVAFPVENNQTYEIAIHPQVTIDAEKPVKVPLDTSTYTDSYEALEDPAKAVTAYVDEIFLNQNNSNFESLVRANKNKLQHEAEEEFYQQLNRISIHGFPEEDSEKIYKMFQLKLAEEANVEAEVRENVHGEATVDFTYETLSLDKLRELMEKYESEYHNDHKGMHLEEANEYARSKIDQIIGQLETVSGEWHVQLIKNDEKWEIDVSDFKNDGLLQIFVNGKEYED